MFSFSIYKVFFYLQSKILSWHYRNIWMIWALNCTWKVIVISVNQNLWFELCVVTGNYNLHLSKRKLMLCNDELCWNQYESINQSIDHCWPWLRSISVFAKLQRNWFALHSLLALAWNVQFSHAFESVFAHSNYSQICVI